MAEWRWVGGLRLVMRGAALGLVVPLGGCNLGVLDAQGPIAAAERLLLFDSTAIMLAVVGPVILMTIGFAWWFRAGNTRATYLPDFKYSGRIELVVWAVPAMVVMFLGAMGWISAHDLDPYRPIPAKAAPLQVQVVSLDWKWLFVYPAQGIAAVNALEIPAGVPIEFHLTSATVMNSFFVPQLGSQIYTMHGMATRLSLLADRAGDYPGRSVQFSGSGFVGMHFMVHAVSPAAFQAWAAGMRGQGKVLDAAAFAGLAKPSSQVAPIMFGGVAPGLFDSIVSGGAIPTGQAAAGKS